MRTAWGSYPPLPTDVSQSGPSAKHTPAVGPFRGEENKYPRFPRPAPWVFGWEWQMQGRGTGWWGELLRVICTSKAAFASDPLSPCEQEVARFNCSFKGSPGLVSAEILGLTLPTPPHPSQKLVQWHRGVKRCKSAFLCLDAYLHALISSTTNSKSFCLRPGGTRAAGLELTPRGDPSDGAGGCRCSCFAPIT